MLRIIDIVLLVIMGVPCWYFLVFALASRLKKRTQADEGNCSTNFAVLIPAYRSDSCIEETAKAALSQNYPEDKFRILVISDSMKEETDSALRLLGAEVLDVSFENSTKAKSLQAAVASLGPGAADKVVILDADNVVEGNFLRSLDAAFKAGAQAVQAHRTAKNRDTSVAVLDAAAEEINNSIFRKGHNALGMSSALIGSGMAFDYAWFAQNIDSINTSGEDKELELALLRDNIDVTYLEDVPVYDEKTRSRSNYYGQRSRWTASQYNIFGRAVVGLGRAEDSLGYIDKLFQWLFPPRMIIMAVVPLMTILSAVFGWPLTRQWTGTLICLAAAMLLAIPGKMLDTRLFKALGSVPALAAMSFANLFRIRRSKENFIHTEHE